ncbi:MAG: DPP IV N-terminal domain-containing protein [Gemmatimonadales bacterium]
MRTIRRIACLLLATLPTAAGFAQSASPARDSAARMAQYRRFLGFAGLVKGGRVTPRWLSDGAAFWYPDGPPDSVTIWRVDPERNQVTPLLDVARTRRAVAEVLGHEPPYRGLPFSTPQLEAGDRVARFTVGGRPLVMSLDDYRARFAPPDPDRERREPQVVRGGRTGGDPEIRELPSPDGRWLARDDGVDLWLRSSTDGRVQRLTSDGTAEAPWSISTNSEVSESPNTARWSPDGLALAAMKADHRGVARLPLVHWLKPVEEVEWRPYVKAGGAMPTTTLAVIDVGSRQVVPVDSGITDRHLVLPIGWLPNGQELLYYRMRRDYKALDVFAADRRTGRSRLLVRESQPTFVKGISSSTPWPDTFTMLPDGRRFLWLSERDGWHHLYLYGIDGTLIRRLTSGTFPVIGVVAVDEADGFVYFTAHAEDRHYDTHLYRVGLDGSGFRRLTVGAGEHAVSLSPNRRFFVDTHSHLDRPPTTELRAADGRLIRTLATASIDSLRRLGWRAAEEAWVAAADGRTPIRAVITTPTDFDPNRKYPVLENIYGGPQLVYAPRGFLGQGFNQALAQLGFIVVTIDARGTAERGKAFQDVVYGQFGRNEIPDHVAALKALAATRPAMDLSRLGIFGGSWGGYMTIRAMVLAPELYRAGVAIYPVADLEDHWNLIEAYMDLPSANPAGYREASSLRLADRIQGRLMLMHGTSDVNATFSATMKMVDALTRAEKQYDLVVFPEETHAMTSAAVAYRTDVMIRHLIRYLEP